MRIAIIASLMLLTLSSASAQIGLGSGPLSCTLPVPSLTRDMCTFFGSKENGGARCVIPVSHDNVEYRLHLLLTVRDTGPRSLRSIKNRKFMRGLVQCELDTSSRVTAVCSDNFSEYQAGGSCSYCYYKDDGRHCQHGSVSAYLTYYNGEKVSLKKLLKDAESKETTAESPVSSSRDSPQ